MDKLTDENRFGQYATRDAPDTLSQEGLVPSREYLLAGFTHKQITDLLHLRVAVAQGRYSETTQEFKRLMFARWLVEHGRLDG